MKALFIVSYAEIVPFGQSASVKGLFCKIMNYDRRNDAIIAMYALTIHIDSHDAQVT